MQRQCSRHEGRAAAGRPVSTSKTSRWLCSRVRCTSFDTVLHCAPCDVAWSGVSTMYWAIVRARAGKRDPATQRGPALCAPCGCCRPAPVQRKRQSASARNLLQVKELGEKSCEQQKQNHCLFTHPSVNTGRVRLSCSELSPPVS